MYRLQGVPYYDFSAKNKYATNYNLAYKRAAQAQSELLDLKNSPNSTVAEIDKWKKRFGALEEKC